MPVADTPLAQPLRAPQAEAGASRRPGSAEHAPAPPNLYLQGLQLLRAGQAAQAAELLASAVAARPGHIGARVNLVRAAGGG